MKKIFLLGLIAALPLLTRCSSEPTAPPEPGWVHQATRVVDNGYIVYVGTGEDPSLERAQFLAEGKALEDLANECSFAPKGTRIEDHYNNKEKYQYHSFAKVAVEIQECDSAQKALDPQAIRELANQPFAEQIQKYQDLADQPEEEEVAQNNNGQAPVAPPASGEGSYNNGYAVHNGFSFFVVSQQVAYQKEVVILSPPTMYQPGAPETVAFGREITPAAAQVQTFAHDNPQIRNTAPSWSNMPNRPNPTSLKPQNLRAMSPRQMNHPLHPPQNPRGGYHPNNKNPNGNENPKRGRRRRGRGEP
jgi:hypothetical protein